MATADDDLQYTAIAAPKGKLVHAISLFNPMRTACDLAVDTKAWLLCRRRLSCDGCKLALRHDARPRRKRKGRR
jgi:hypothetical protein